MISQYIWLPFQIKMLESKEDVLFTCPLSDNHNQYPLRYFYHT